MAELTSAGATIHYQVDGSASAPPLLLSNSLGTSAGMWDAVLSALAARFRVIRYDQRGHGASSAPTGDYSLATLGADALAVLDATGARRADVAGVSLGGLTGLWLAIHAPDRVGRLVFANSGAKIGGPELWNQRIATVARDGMAAIVEPILERWLTAEFRRANPDVVARFRTMLLGTPVAGYIGCSAAVRDADLRADLGRVAAPTLVIVGTADIATPPALGEAVRAGIPGARAAALDTGHLSNVERPEEFARALFDFFDGSGGSDG